MFHHFCAFIHLQEVNLVFRCERCTNSIKRPKLTIIIITATWWCWIISHVVILSDSQFHVHAKHQQEKMKRLCALWCFTSFALSVCILYTVIYTALLKAVLFKSLGKRTISSQQFEDSSVLPAQLDHAPPDEFCKKSHSDRGGCRPLLVLQRCTGCQLCKSKFNRAVGLVWL